VNTGFRGRPHGFELVDFASRKITGARVNRKFTRPSAANNFAQIFRELSSRQSLAIYPELLGRTPRGHRRGGI
ncbi:hypothetical protein, partial [Bradyrhizobium sp. P5_C11_2]